MLKLRNLVLLRLVFVLSLLGSIAIAQNTLEPPAGHGMLVFGDESIYLSHLPMYAPVHRYQIILEVGFSKDALDAEAVYRDDLATSDDIYTIAPTESFVLPNQVLSLKSFQADLYRGHFEDGAGRQRILEDVTVDIKRMVHFHQFRSQDRPASPLGTTYLLFGKPSELFLAHWIEGPNNYDHILSVARSDVDIAASDLSSAVLIRVPGQLEPNETVRGQLGDFLPGGAMPISLELGDEYYLEEGELSVPPAFRF